MTGHIPESQPINQYSARLDGDEFAPDNRTGEEDAVDFIIDACNRYGGELIVIGIGPLTNLARAIIKDPVALSRVKATVIMGGDFGDGPPEWNIFCDPVGAQTVFGQAKALTAVGVEITGRTRLTQAQTAVLENAAQTGFFEYVGELVRMWRQAHGGALPVLHDVLAVCCLNTDVCAFAEGRYAVDTDRRPGALLAGRGQSVRYATGLDKEAFIREFMSIWQQ